MTAYTVLREAAKLVRNGWCQGASCADELGQKLLLWETGPSETGRAHPNSQAVRWSAYGAIVKAQFVLRKALMAADWNLVMARAKAACDGYPTGGTNWVHPLIQFNETPGRTADEVAGLLDRCADELEYPSAVAGRAS